MTIPMLDLKRQYALLEPELEPKILDCLRGGAYVMGEPVTHLEQTLAAYLGVRHAVAVGNGTDALTIALVALGVGPGDEVITTPFTFFATAEAVASLGATPVFADVRPDTYNLDPESVAKCITPRTKAILPVHIFGQPADMDALNAIARAHKLAVIEDACQAIGAAIGGRKVGGWGDVGCFSFFPTKNLGAFGDGGLLTTNNDEYATLFRALRAHGGGHTGAAARALLEGKPVPPSPAESENPLYNPYKYYNYIIGYNSRLDTLQAVILNVKFPHLDEWNAQRTKNAAFYQEHIHRTDITLPHQAAGTTHVWHQFALCTRYKKEMGEALAKQGIGSGVFYPVPLHLQKAFDTLQYRPGALPVSEMLARETLCLPVFPGMTEEELSYVADAVNAFKP
ncbi:MAG: DegT/DnrJ/EryC1/StrS family aminotransferase [Ethanoligenens sp.]